MHAGRSSRSRPFLEGRFPAVRTNEQGKRRVNRVLTAGFSPATGEPLTAADKAFFGSAFGTDLSVVRIHADQEAAESAGRLGANAYTIGRDVFFGTGLYEPSTHVGRRLLAHELAHVVQQERGGSVAPITDDPRLETAAEQAAADVMRSGYATVSGSARIGIARQPQRSSAQADMDPQEQREGDIRTMLGLGISLSKLVDFFRMPRRDWMDKYGFYEFFRFRRSVRKLPIAVLGRLLPQEDQTEYLQPSGRISTNAEEKATQLENFDPGTPLGGVAYVGARAFGASHETAQGWQAGGNLLNAGLAAPGTAQGTVPPVEETQFRAPVTPPPEHVAPVELPRQTESIPAPTAVARSQPTTRALSEGEVTPPTHQLPPHVQGPETADFAKNVGSYGERVVEREVFKNFLPDALQFSAKTSGFDGAEGARVVSATTSVARDGVTTVIEEKITGGNWYQIKGVSEPRANLIVDNVNDAMKKAARGLSMVRQNQFERTAPGFAYRTAYAGPPDRITIFLRLAKGSVTKDLVDAANNAVRQSPYVADLPSVQIVIVGH